MSDRAPNLWHAPRPGPGYWDWRCLVCDEPVSDHPIFWRRWWHRWQVGRNRTVLHDRTMEGE